MAKRSKTLKDLIDAAVVASGVTFTAWCNLNQLNPRLIYRWLSGVHREPQRQSVASLARAVGLRYDQVEPLVLEARRGVQP
jgi:hypothetical protein